MTILWKFKNCSIVGGLWNGNGRIRNCKTFFIGQFGTFIFVACGKEMRSLWYFIFYMSEISIFNFTEYFWDFTKFPTENRNRVKFPPKWHDKKCLQLFFLCSRQIQTWNFHTWTGTCSSVKTRNMQCSVECVSLTATSDKGSTAYRMW